MLSIAKFTSSKSASTRPGLSPFRKIFPGVISSGAAKYQVHPWNLSLILHRTNISRKRTQREGRSTASDPWSGPAAGQRRSLTPIADRLGDQVRHFKSAGILQAETFGGCPQRSLLKKAPIQSPPFVLTLLDRYWHDDRSRGRRSYLARAASA